MKQIHYIIGALALLACSCSNDNVESAAPAAEMVTVRVSTDAAPEIVDDTRTTLLGNKVMWHADDAVAYVTYPTTSKFTNIEPAGVNATFEGEIPSTAVDKALQVLLYPYMEPLTALERTNEGLKNVVHPSTQELVVDDFTRGSNISIGAFKWNDQTATLFKNITGLVCLKLKGNTTVTSVKITAPDYITGTFQISSTNQRSGESAEYSVIAQTYTGNNPAAGNTVTMESFYGVPLSSQSKTFYATVMPVTESEAYSKKDWSVTVTTNEGQVETYTMRLKKGIAQGKITYLEEIGVYGAYFMHTEYMCDKSARTGEIAKSKYLTEAYTVESPDSWITPSVSENGVSFTLTENTTGAVRKGTIDVKIGGEVVATLTVNQHYVDYSSYESFIGSYFFSYKNIDGGKTNASFVISALEDGVSYKASMKLTNKWEYVLTLQYNADGSLSLILPQDTEKNYGNEKWTAKMHPSKNILDKEFKPTKDNYSEIDASAEGVGYNLVPSYVNGKICFEMHPNAKAQELYPEGLSGIFATYYLPAAPDTVDDVKEWLRPLDGELYLKLSNGDTTSGSHDGFTKK